MVGVVEADDALAYQGVETRQRAGGWNPMNQRQQTDRLDQWQCAVQLEVELAPMAAGPALGKQPSEQPDAGAVLRT